MFDDRGSSDLHFRTGEPPLLGDEPTGAIPTGPRVRARAGAVAPAATTSQAAASAAPRATPAPAAPPAMGAPAPFTDDDLPTSFYRRRGAVEPAPRPRPRSQPQPRADAPAADFGGRRREPTARAGVGQSTVLLPSSNAPTAAAVDDGTVILPGRATPAQVDAVTEVGRRRGKAPRIDRAAELRALLEAVLQRRGAIAAAAGVAAIAALTCALTRGDDPGALHEILARARWLMVAAGGAGGG